jgi:predicted nuclease with TOPRIM domain
MDVKDYCEVSKSELMEWKAKVKNILSKLDGIPIGDKETLYPVANELQTIINEITDKIEVLNKECPADWDLQKKEIDGKFSSLKKKVREVLEKLPSEAFIG